MTPLPARVLSQSQVRLSQVRLDDRGVWWVEQRPAEAGLSTLVHAPFAGAAHDIVAYAVGGERIDVATHVHEYGGLAYVVGGGELVVCHGGDNRLYRIDSTGSAHPLTPPANTRFGDLELDLARGLVYAVCEDHADVPFRTDPVTTLVAIDLAGERPLRTLVSGHDFLTSPRLAPDGGDLAYVAWQFPAMPWTAASVFVASLDDAGAITATTHIAGGDGVAAGQPTWCSARDLAFTSDQTGYTNIWRTEGFAAPGRPAEPLRLRPVHLSDHDFNRPQWGLGPKTLAARDDDTLATVVMHEGHARLMALRVANGEGDVWRGQLEISCLDARDGRIAFIGADSSTGPGVYLLDPQLHTLRPPAPSPLPAAAISIAQDVTWPVGPHLAHGFFYAPSKQSEGLPPLIVMTHGGPTSAAAATFNLEIQFWTTRGFAVLDVNYRGSTGWGRHYQEQLAGQWGIVEVADVAAGASWLASQGKVDGSRMGIRGGSAGGFTTLAALAFTNVFSGGASRYGVADLEALAEDTHKFESRYLDLLVGPYPQTQSIYRARSPIHHVDSLSSPMILLQGEQDKVVPPQQAHVMADALRAKGIAVELVLFPAEGHGFKAADAIEQALEAELAFFTNIWNMAAK